MILEYKTLQPRESGQLASMTEADAVAMWSCRLFAAWMNAFWKHWNNRRVEALVNLLKMMFSLSEALLNGSNLYRYKWVKIIRLIRPNFNYHFSFSYWLEYKEVLLYLFYIYITRFAATLSDLIGLWFEWQKRKMEGTVCCYSKAGNYSVKTYATDDDIADKDAISMRFTRQSNLMPREYAGARWNKAPRCSRVYDDRLLKGFFYILYWNPFKTVCIHTEVLKNTTVHDLAQQTTSLTSLLSDSQSTDSP